ncbi:uncharacterized protein B0H18DRAFT_1053838 [Fomitopsis serialis]|uniref:uncharacterized protein n=1 Tax=Fomitopsis serialis TaxID=139415 RepID=UPI0020083779|nr:uncharacterized protein B0H18DRAFT_1053838 [Neoantrodia serialis]KAH9912464.1 hypothetical protein B0H18DRAFT_1053838 [Neoantrodia serialis]
MLGPAFALAVPLLGSLASAASTGVAAESLNALTRHCQFTLGNRRFDLCPVFEGNDGGWTVGFERSTPPTVTKAEYRISFAGPLKTTKWTPHDEQCPDGTWVCKIISNVRPKREGESPRVLQVIPVAGDISGSLPKKDDGGDGFAGEEYQPGLNVTAKLVPADENTRHDILHIHLHGGYYVYKQQKADFQFICDHQAEEPTKPSIYWNWNGTHTFEWRTKHACGQAMTAPDDDSPPPTPPKHNPGSDEPPKDSEDDDVPGDKKILDPDFLYGQTRRSIMTIFASSALVVIVVTYLVQRPPARLRRFALSYMKTHPWLMHSRVGERMLMRWAREDLIFDAGEEDVMINGPTNVRSAVGLDEGIPLKPSPRRPNNYGSA